MTPPRAAFSLLATSASVGLLIAISVTGYTLDCRYFFFVILPCAAFVSFLAGIAFRVIRWTVTPVQLPGTLTGGQQRSLTWVPPARLEAPASQPAAWGRLLLEALCFRSLLRNSAAVASPKHPTRALAFFPSPWLWGAALLFHYSLLVIVLRHCRFVLDPVPAWLMQLRSLDMLFSVSIPGFFLSDFFFMLALAALLLRRLRSGELQALSLTTDYFFLLLLAGIAVSGLGLRHGLRVDANAVKALFMGLLSLNPVLPEAPPALLYVHVALTAALLILFPHSKLVHAVGLFFSPARNMPNNSRAIRYAGQGHGLAAHRSYSEYEEEFRDSLLQASLPLETAPNATPQPERETP